MKHLKVLRSIAALVMVAAWASPAGAQPLSGKVVGVADGDTLTVLTADHHQVKIRIDEVDAPEKAQAFGQASKRSLSDLCFGREAQANVLKTDRYGRSVAAVRCQGIDVGEHQVRNGMAWAYRQYLRNKQLLQLEEGARRSRAGLWRDADATPPWEFRREAKSAGGMHLIKDSF